MSAFTFCKESEHNKYVNRACYLEFQKQISELRLIYSLRGEHTNIRLSSLFIPLSESMKFSFLIVTNFFECRSSYLYRKHSVDVAVLAIARSYRQCVTGPLSLEPTVTLMVRWGVTPVKFAKYI